MIKQLWVHHVERNAYVEVYGTEEGQLAEADRE